MITLSNDKRQKAADIAEVFRKSGIRRPVDDLERIQRMIDNCDILITAWEGNKMVGVARAVSDFSYCCYLSDLAVDKEYQAQGIGRQLINEVQAVIGGECSLVLLSAPGAVEYYPKVGFARADNAYVIKRLRN
jgi:predicted N-acetyltransferase YhbS